MRLPLLVSVPHAGFGVPEPYRDRCLLDDDDLSRDSDTQASDIYRLKDDVLHFVTTDIARAVVDLNRAPDDIRPDGVVKTRTAFETRVWRDPLSKEEIANLIATYHHPYHRALSSPRPGVQAGVDCHTMLEFGPLIGPSTGERRPQVCLSDGEGTTMPSKMMEPLVAAFEKEFDEVAVNEPFKGGYITRHHGREMPWVQIEVNRGDFLSVEEKRDKVIRALNRWWYSVG